MRLMRLLAIALVVSGCTAGAPAATPTPTPTVASPTPTPVPSPTPPIAAGVPGAIQGRLTAPGPALRIYVVETAAPGRYRVLDTDRDQPNYYVANLPPGAYQVFAIVLGGSDETHFTGAYTKAVGCGTGASCTDHSPLTVDVKAATVADKIDLTDLSVPASALPAVPTGREPFKAGAAVVVANPYGDEVNIRDGAGIGARVIGTLANNVEATVVSGPKAADGYDWYVIKTAQGTATAAGFAFRTK